ncbi:MAG: outer membrane receptor protein, partial [Muribaculaceae bacterium]|nr:outer membrane receptor protein [Muribaculaceae bacterium]
PTIDYLFPQCHYNDLIQLNYYDATNPQEYSRINLRTYKVDATNYALQPARNSKWELRLNASWGNNRLAVGYFQERMTDGFRYSSVYSPYAYRKYDASAIDPTTLTAPPALDGLPYEDVRVLDGFRRASNGTRILKRGIEYQISTERWRPLCTSLIINGAWFKSTYSNSQMLYSTVNDVVGNQAVSDLYVGVYDTTDGRVNEQFNTNFMFDTQIPRWGLIFSTTVQCLWYVKTTRLRDNPIPHSYISAADGLIHPYTPEAVDADRLLGYLVKTYNDDAYRTFKVPTAVYVNLKATKQIGRWLRISAFVNRIVDYLPDYKSNGMSVRRYSDAYFGMEATVTI